MVHLGRPINECLKAHIPGPTARTTQTLGFGQIGLAAPQPPFRLPRDRNIRYRSDKLDPAGPISRPASHGMDVFHCAIRHQQSVFMIEILSVAGGLLDGVLHGRAIFRMGALENKFQGRLCRLVALEDSKGLL